MNPGSGETSHGQMAQILTPNHHRAAADGAVSRLKQEGHLVVNTHTPLWQVVFMLVFLLVFSASSVSKFLSDFYRQAII